MKTKVNRTIETIETVQTEVEFPKYTRNDFSYCKHYSEDHCVMVNVIGDTFASVLVTHNNKGRNLFDKEISEAEFNRVMAKASEMLMPELQPKQEERSAV
jgi:hypothetical protein